MSRRRLGVGDPATQFRLALFQLAPVGRLDLLELALELLTRCPDLLLELGLALDEVGTMGGSTALELGLRGAELVLQHAPRAAPRCGARGAPCAHPPVRAGALASCASAVVRASRICSISTFAASTSSWLREVALGRPHRGELSAGGVELLLRHGELGVQADRFQLGFAEPQILLVVVDDAHRLLDRFLELRGQALALLA